MFEAANVRTSEIGSRAVRDVIADAALRPFDVCKLLYRLIVLGRAMHIDAEGDGEVREKKSVADGFA